MATPLIIINFKTYPQYSGQKGLTLAKQFDEVAREAKKKAVIGLAPQLTDLSAIGGAVRDALVFSQHVDPSEPGAHTGAVNVEAIKTAKATGSLLNHSERQVDLGHIRDSIRRLRDAGLISVVCANDLSAARSIAKLNPDYIAYEPPEFIGSTTTSVMIEKADVLATMIKEVKRINPKLQVLAGAGVKDATDLSKALELGASGVLLASAITRAAEPKKALRDLLTGC